MFWQKKAEPEEASVLKGGRKKCYEARDRFYECADELGTPDETVPKQCRELRKAYEEACAASWVEHFDKLRAVDVQLVKKLHANINKNHARARGEEAGKDLS